MKVSKHVSVAIISSCLLAGPAIAQEEKAADLGAYSVGERRSGIKQDEIKIERPKFENTFKLETTKPSFEGMQFSRPKLEILSGPDEPAGGGSVASAAEAAKPSPGAAPSAAPAGGETRSVQPLSMEPPSYPRDALRRQQEGYVVVEFTINAEGRTEDINVAEAEPRNTFDREAQRAVARWRFEPALRDGRPVPQRIRHTIEFSLNGQ